MKRFQFRLDPVLRVRRHRLDRQRVELASALAQLVRSEREEGALGRELREAEAALRTRLEGGVDGASLALALDASGRLRFRHRVCENARERAETDVAEARRRVAEAHRGVRALERLRERRRDEHQREAARREQHELEEAAQLAAGGAQPEAAFRWGGRS